MRAYQFLLEDKQPLKIKPEDLIDYIKENCPIAFERAKQGFFIFRGFYDDSPVMLYNPHKTPRISPYAKHNYYNLLLSNLNNWKNYPKRNLSLICATTYNLASGYGDVHVVFPFDNPKIGICSDVDGVTIM